MVPGGSADGRHKIVFALVSHDVALLVRFLQASPPPICRLPQPIFHEKKSRGASPPPSVPQHNCCFAQHKAPARGSRNAQDSSATSLAALCGTTAATGPLFGRWAVLPGLGTSQTTHERQVRFRARPRDARARLHPHATCGICGMWQKKMCVAPRGRGP